MKKSGQEACASAANTSSPQNKKVSDETPKAG
jgi:hypothetical protein